MRKAPKLTHLDAAGNARMVEVGAKGETARVAVATGTVKMSAVAFDALARGAGAPPGRARTRVPITAKKGDVLAVARVAGIMAAKRTAEWIPLCHPVPLTSVEVEFALDRKASRVAVTATTRCIARTGVEMEALTAVSAAALTIYDMLKAVDRGIEIERIRLLAKSGGKSGDWKAT